MNHPEDDHRHVTRAWGMYGEQREIPPIGDWVRQVRTQLTSELTITGRRRWVAAAAGARAALVRARGGARPAPPRTNRGRDGVDYGLKKAGGQTEKKKMKAFMGRVDRGPTQPWRKDRADRCLGMGGNQTFRVSEASPRVHVPRAFAFELINEASELLNLIMS